MKYSSRLSDSVHILVLIALNPLENLSSSAMAVSIHTNAECGVGVNIQYALQDSYDEVQKTAEKKMAEITLADIISDFRRKSSE